MPIADAASTSQPMAPGGLATVLLMLMDVSLSHCLLKRLASSDCSLCSATLQCSTIYMQAGVARRKGNPSRQTASCGDASDSGTYVFG